MTTYFTHVISPDEYKDLAGDRASLQRGSLGVDEIALLDAVSPGWSLSKFDHSWNWNAIATADFYRHEGRHPRTRSENTDEVGLSGWLGKQRSALKNNTLRPDRRAWLDEHCPTWNETLDDVWDQKAIAAADFYRRKVRHPNSESKNPGEAKLGAWLGTQRKHLKNNTLRPDRRAWLDEHYPTWNETLDDVWGQRAIAAADFYKREGRHPKKSPKYPDESGLGNWLSSQRKAFRNGTLRPDYRAWLDEHYPTWNETLDDVWGQRAIAAADFYKREGRHPSDWSKNSDEAKMGRWLRDQRRALKANTLRPDRRAWLDEHYPTWNETLDDVWGQRAIAAADFYKREGRHPSNGSKNPSEAKMGRWLGTQRREIKNNTLRPDRRAWLDEHYPTWATARP